MIFIRKWYCATDFWLAISSCNGKAGTLNLHTDGYGCRSRSTYAVHTSLMWRHSNRDLTGNANSWCILHSVFCNCGHLSTGHFLSTHCRSWTLVYMWQLGHSYHHSKSPTNNQSLWHSQHIIHYDNAGWGIPHCVHKDSRGWEIVAHIQTLDPARQYTRFAPHNCSTLQKDIENLPNSVHTDDYYRWRYDIRCPCCRLLRLPLAPSIQRTNRVHRSTSKQGSQRRQCTGCNGHQCNGHFRT